MLGKDWHFGFVLRDWLEFFENPMEEEIRKEMLLSKKLHREKKELTKDLHVLWGEQDPRTNGDYRLKFKEHFPDAEESSISEGYHSLQYTHAEDVQKFLLSSLTE